MMIFAALIGLIGIIGSQYLIHRNTLLREDRATIQKKADEIVKLLFENHHWHNEQRLSLFLINESNYLTYEGYKTVPPIEEAITLQLMYFKNLNDEMKIVYDSHNKQYETRLKRLLQLMKEIKDVNKLSEIKNEMNCIESEEIKLLSDYKDKALNFTKYELIPAIPAIPSFKFSWIQLKSVIRF